MYLIRHQMCDCLYRDSDQQLTPRLSALINSAFYRILMKEERLQVHRQIASLELQLIQKTVIIKNSLIQKESNKDNA